MEPDESRATPEMRRALSSFYREEFVRHLEHLQSNGLVHAGNRDVIDRAYTKLMKDLESVCCRDDFPALAESLLQGFDTLTRLSSLDRRYLDLARTFTECLVGQGREETRDLDETFDRAWKTLATANRPYRPS